MPLRVFYLLLTLSLSLPAYEIEGHLEIVGWREDGLVAQGTDQYTLLSDSGSRVFAKESMRENGTGAVVGAGRSYWYGGSVAEFSVQRIRTIAGFKSGFALLDQQDGITVWAPAIETPKPVHLKKMGSAVVAVFNRSGSTISAVLSTGEILEVTVASGDSTPVPKWKARTGEITAALIVGNEVAIGTDGGRLIIGEYDGGAQKELELAEASIVDYIVPIDSGFLCFLSPGLKVNYGSTPPKIEKGKARQMIRVTKINNLWTIGNGEVIEKEAYPKGVAQFNATYYLMKNKATTTYSREAK